MKNTAVIYWSATGNTEAMAKAIFEGMESAGAKAQLLEPQQVRDISGYDAIAFGCPAMGAEELEEGEFSPMFSAVKAALAGKPVALFGSYGWGDGQWMRTWEADCRAAGAALAAESIICCGEPSEAELEACRQLGKVLAS